VNHHNTTTASSIDLIDLKLATPLIDPEPTRNSKPATMRTSLLIISFVAVLCVVAMPATAWTFIPYPYNPNITTLGWWAVVEHNKHSHDGLGFERVWSVEKQDLDYGLVIHAVHPSGERGSFIAVVRTEACGKPSKLISFNPIT
jgi:hypothetical protein